MTSARFSAVVAVCLAIIPSFGIRAAEKVPTARMGTDAAVRMDGDDARLQFVLFSGGGCLETVNESAARVGSDLSLNYRFVRLPKTVLGAGRATLRSTGPSAVVAHSFTAHSTVKDQPYGFLLRLRASAFRGLQWSADGKSFGFPGEPEHTNIGRGEGKSFSFVFPGGRKWSIAFPRTMRYEGADARRQNKDDFEIRFVYAEKLNLPVGKGVDASCTLTPDGGRAQVAARDFHGIGQGASWVKLDRAEGIRPSSALDFSKLVPRRTPAGVDGALTVTTNGEFRFARRPAEPQRLFGCQVGSHELFVNKQAATEYSKALTRMGYNAIRLARLDARLVTEGPKGLQSDPDLGAKLDQFVTLAGRSGIYSIIDIQNSRGWSWGAIGQVAPGKDPPSTSLASTFFLCDDRAVGSWNKLADAVYGRRNTVGRRNYCDDPAVPLVLALADVSPFSAWSEIRAQKGMRERYGRWLADKRKAEPDFMNGAVCEEMDFAIMPLHEKKAASIRRFLAECEVSGIAKMKGRLSSLKSKALVGAAFSSHYYQDVAAQRAMAGDFTCDAFHIDSPRYMGEKYSAPCRIDNANPLLSPSPVSNCVAWHERPDRAMCIASWNAAAPSAWRAVSGLLVGAWAAKHGWDVLIRDVNPIGDPLAAATERAICMLFARGDMSRDAPTDAFVIAKGGLTVKTPRTVGGFSPEAEGRIVAAPLAATLKGSRAAVWVSSLTDAPVVSSKRLLLTHLTEMQTEGTLFADSRCDLMMRRGKGPYLLRDGSAVIELAVEKPSTFKVFVLGSDGTRSVRVPTEVKDGLLMFTAEVRGSKNAQYLYEITRE